MEVSEAPAIVLFDGVCNLCNGTVQFIIRHDPNKRFLFAAIQSPAGQSLLAEHGMQQLRPDSVLLIEKGRIYSRSTAALKIASKLRVPWPLFAVFLVVPGPLRDMFYNLIAHNRYRLFGKRDACMLPSPQLRARFLDQQQPPGEG